MNQTAIITFCKELGCCDTCCLRYLGLKNPNVYENCRDYILKLQSKDTDKRDPGNSVEEKPDIGDSVAEQTISPLEKSEDPKQVENGDEPACKKFKTDDICVCCMGLLQEESWPNYFQAIQPKNKDYMTDTFACGLSAPITTLLREKVITLRLLEEFKDYDAKTLTPLKEAWKWTFGVRMAKHIGKTLDSGAVSPLLITLNMEYPDDIQELEIVKTLSPSLFESRSRQRRRFAVEFTRRSVEEALASVTLGALRGVAAVGGVGGVGGAQEWGARVPPPSKHVKCVSVVSVHAPMYLAGRYIKLSRELPQTPWILNGVRMMESSVQEIIFEPIAKFNEIPAEDVERRLKFISAGREDVDVRCLGQGRPFALEITDPRKQLSRAEVRAACEQISAAGTVLVKDLVYVSREDLTQLKKGEESKCKTYEALCIKLSHSAFDHIEDPESEVRVTCVDIERMNSMRNTPPGDEAKVAIAQKTPVRVLHRRPLLQRNRRIFTLTAHKVPDHPSLFRLAMKTEAGTYVKEWVHGDLGRTRPSLGDAIKARVDILALDVAAVHLHWPPNNKT